MTTLPTGKQANPLYWKAALKTILLAGLVAGTLDILGAIILYGPVLGKLSVQQVFQSIASGAFGKSAYKGGWQTALYGGVFHYFIACCFAAAYFLAFPYVEFFKKQKVVSGLLYGLIVWLFMNLVVLPLVFDKLTFRWDAALKGAAVLMLAVGLPISFIVHRYYTRGSCKG